MEIHQSVTILWPWIFRNRPFCVARKPLVVLYSHCARVVQIALHYRLHFLYHKHKLYHHPILVHTFLSVHVGALCNVDPPNITLAAMSTLESTSIDIVGAQANYSCNGDCTLNGSSSLRCMRGMQSLNDYMWLDENGSDNYPNCVCSSELILF